VDWNLGYFGHDGADRRPLRRPRLKFPFQQRGRRAQGEYNAARFEVKKEIPVRKEMVTPHEK